MGEDEARLYGKITLLEFLLEVVYANEFATRGQAELERVRGDVVNRLRFRSHAAPGADTEAAMQVQTVAVAQAEKFFDGVRDRVRSILEKT